MLPSVPRCIAAVAAWVFLLTLGGCSGEDPATTSARVSTLTVATLDDLGEALVDGTGSVLYVFEPDEASTVSCTFTCASNWPPLAAVDGAPPTAGGGVDARLLGELPNPAGGEVVTYNGWPLYRYAADKRPGQHRGQDIDLNGGSWYVMTPAGEPLVP